MNSDNIWALRGVASRMGQVGHLAVVALCDDLLAARKERDAAESALENIRSARNANADAAMVLVRVREAAGARSGTDIVEAVRGLRALACSAAGHAEVVAAMLGYIGDVRRAAGLRVGEGLVRFVGEMRKRLEANEALERVGDDIMAEVRNAAGAKLGDDIVEIVKELRCESEGLYRFKLRIREALGVEKGVDMAEVIRGLKSGVLRDGPEYVVVHRDNWDERAKTIESLAAAVQQWEKDFRAVAKRADHLDHVIGEIAKELGCRDHRPEALIEMLKAAPTVDADLRRICQIAFNNVPEFLKNDTKYQEDYQRNVTELGKFIRDAVGRAQHLPYDQVIIDNKELIQLRAISERIPKVVETIAEIGRIVGAKDLTADGVLAHVKSLPNTCDELRRIASNGLGYIPAFLAVGRCEGLADDVLRTKLEAEIRCAIARGTGSPFMRDTLYQLCEQAGIEWPGEKVDGVDNVRKAISSFIRARIAEVEFMRTQAEAASKRAKEAEANADNRHDNVVMRQNLAEKTVECEKLQARVRVLESTIREHEKDLKVIEELQDEQTKLNALLMRMADGKRITARGVPVVPDRSCRHTWGWLICRGKAKA